MVFASLVNRRICGKVYVIWVLDFAVKAKQAQQFFISMLIHYERASLMVSTENTFFPFTNQHTSVSLFDKPVYKRLDLSR